MQGLLADYFERLTRLHDDIKQAIDALPPEALDWVPGAGMNSLAVLVTHTAQSERYWVGQMAGGDDAGRVRSEEFETRGRTADTLVAHLDASLAHSRRTLEALTLAALDDTRPHPERGEVRVGWSLMHALEHTAMHAGHIQLTRQLWDQRG